MYRLVIIFYLIMIISSKNIYANQYSSDANEMMQSQDPMQSFNDEVAKNVNDNYQGAQADQTKYYENHHQINSDANSQINDSEEAQLMHDVLYKSPDYNINPDEEWMQNMKNAQDNPEGVVSVISNNFDDCGISEKSCKFYNSITNKSCEADRVVNIAQYHKYSCNKNKYSYDRSCVQDLNLQCKETFYGLPNITYNNFESFNYQYPYINLGSGRRVGQNCSGYIYQLKFHLDSVDQVESFKINKISVDDRTVFYVNNKQVYKYPNTNRCEVYRTSTTYPNFNLKPHLKVGENILKVRFVVGGLGNFTSRIELKYKKCKSYLANKWVETCSLDKGLADDECSIVEKSCIEQGGARNIGFNVFEKRDCWKYSVKKECTPADYLDYCSDLFDSKDCSQDYSQCLNMGNTECIEYLNNYKCANNDIQTSEYVKYEGFTKEIAAEYIDDNQCNIFASNNACSFTDEYCIDDTSKTISGMNIDRECWKYNRDYSCVNPSDNMGPCTDLENSCNFSYANCLEYEVEDVCKVYERFYNCNNKGDQNADIAICGSQIYCEGSNCEDVEYEEDKDFAQSAGKLMSIQEAGIDISQDGLTAFTGENNKCGRDLINYSDCCVDSGWSDDVGLDNCSTDEKALALKKQENLCVYMGEYCSDKEKLTGLCLKKKKSYCCFNSKLSRIVQQQGRSQLGIGWGSAESPNCSGIIISDLERIDFSQIDFSELTAEIESSGQSIYGESVQKNINDVISNYYQKQTD